jgi:hypothetical protein
VSNVSPLSTTAPSFPYYKGLNVTDTASRKVHAEALIANQVLQGIKGRGVGEYERDLSRKRGNFSTYKPNVSFAVDSAVRWNPSTFPMQEGEVSNNFG